MKLNQIADNPGARKNRMRIGRGIGSGMGKTGGRGGKGQTARSGVRIKGFEGGQMPMQRRLPKRGFKNQFRVEYFPVNLGHITARFETETVDVDMLKGAGMVPKTAPRVKILAEGEVTRKMTIRAHAFSEGAKAKLEKAGGAAELIPTSVPPATAAT